MQEVHVGIVGLGGLGHMGVKIAVALGADVVFFTTSPGKVKDAMRLGAKEVVISKNEDEMKKLGANYIQSGLWRSFAVRAGNLVTGQQNFSGAETAAVVAEALGE